MHHSRSWQIHGTPARCTLQFVRRCYGVRGIYGRFDSKSNRTADSIKDSIRTQKNDSQVPNQALYWEVLDFKKGPAKNWRGVVKKDLRRMGLIWVEVEAAALNRQEWSQCMNWHRLNQCHFMKYLSVTAVSITTSVLQLVFPVINITQHFFLLLCKYLLLQTSKFVLWQWRSLSLSN